MKKTIFQGMATAMVKPMTPEGVDYEALGRFIDFQLVSGINALVAVGTTGESATLTPEEREKVIAFTIDRVAGRVPVIAGTRHQQYPARRELLCQRRPSRCRCPAGGDPLL